MFSVTSIYVEIFIVGGKLQHSNALTLTNLAQRGDVS